MKYSVLRFFICIFQNFLCIFWNKSLIQWQHLWALCFRKWESQENGGSLQANSKMKFLFFQPPYWGGEAVKSLELIPKSYLGFCLKSFKFTKFPTSHCFELRQGREGSREVGKFPHILVFLIYFEGSPCPTLFFWPLEDGGERGGEVRML